MEHQLSTAELPSHTHHGPQATVAIGDNRNFTAEEIQQLQQQHSKIKQFEVGDRIICFRQPSRLEMALANKELAKTKDVSRYTDTILNTCQLNYKEETRTNDELYFALVGITDQLVTTLSATLKN
jgi:hypothetical protein